MGFKKKQNKTKKKTEKKKNGCRHSKIDIHFRHSHIVLKATREATGIYLIYK